jgi:glycosyltransferase involved in cell wall biosynthesis
LQLLVNNVDLLDDSSPQKTFTKFEDSVYDLSSSKMRIGLVITRGDEFGGAQLHVSYIAKYLAQKGYRVDVITGTTGAFTDRLSQQGAKITKITSLSRSVNFFNDFAAVYSLTKLLAQTHFDLVSAHSSKAGFVAALSARLTNTPVIFTAHSWPFLQGRSPFANQIYRIFSYLTCYMANRVVCVCAHDYELISQSKFITGEKFSVIHNGVPDLSAPVREKKPRDTEASCRLVMVARLAHPKDPALLLRVMSEFRGTSLTLVGDGPGRAALEKLAHHLKIEERVTFIGESPAPERFVATADIVLLITRSEGLPLAVLEGLRAGKPVIATAVGGIPEVITDGDQGFLVKPNCHSDLSSKLRILVHDQSLRNKMGTCARRTYETYFSDKTMLSRTHAIYRDIFRQARSK